MTESERLVTATILSTAALVWWLGIEGWHKWSRVTSAWAFWLRALAPWVASALLLAAFWLLINTERLRRARGVSPTSSSSRRGPDSWPHVRGCWVVDLVLGKQERASVQQNELVIVPRPALSTARDGKDDCAGNDPGEDDASNGCRGRRRHHPNPSHSSTTRERHRRPPARTGRGGPAVVVGSDSS